MLDFENLKIITTKKEWNEVLKAMEAFDFYHTYDYHQLSLNPHEKAVLIYYTENTLKIALPLIIRPIENSTYKDATSVYGYAGPIQSRDGVTLTNTSHFKKALDNYFDSEGIISVFSRLNPYIKSQPMLLDGIGEILTLSHVVNIDLTLDLDSQRALFSKTTKRYLNKARKLLDIKISNNPNDIKEFIDLYYQNMDRVNAKDLYYFEAYYFYKFVSSQDFKTEVVFAVEKATQKIVSAAMMVKTNKIIQYHLSGTKNEHLNLSPIRLIIDETRIKGTQEQFTHFNLGGGLGNQDDELFKFKASFSKDFKSFKVWKYITNNEVYNQLVKETDGDKSSNFFPLYRLK